MLSPWCPQSNWTETQSMRLKLSQKCVVFVVPSLEIFFFRTVLYLPSQLSHILDHKRNYTSLLKAWSIHDNCHRRRRQCLWSKNCFTCFKVILHHVTNYLSYGAILSCESMSNCSTFVMQSNLSLLHMTTLLHMTYLKYMLSCCDFHCFDATFILSHLRTFTIVC